MIKLPLTHAQLFKSIISVEVVCNVLALDFHDFFSPSLHMNHITGNFHSLSIKTTGMNLRGSFDTLIFLLKCLRVIAIVETHKGLSSTFTYE